MFLTIRSFCLVYSISSALADQLPQHPGKGELPSFIPQLQNYNIHVESKTYRKRANVPEESVKEPELRYFLDPWNTQSIFKRDRSYYGHRNDSATPRIFKTYGRGKVQVTRQGQTVNVPNELARNAHHRSKALKVFDKHENEIKGPRRRGGCRECPNDQTVYAAKGKTFAILPEPCQTNPKMWTHHSGPRPGSKIQGVHLIQGFVGPKKRFCQFNYEVLVRKCEPLKVKESDVRIKCSAENAWGSNCTVSCGDEKEPLGPTNLECKEDLTWSNPLPTCKSKSDCSAPKVKANSNISCQTADSTPAEGDVLPNGSSCKLQQNEKEVFLNCKDGRWRIIRKSKNPQPKKANKQESKVEKKDVCNPNPCENGGTCLRTDSDKESLVCKCRPQTRGLHCEMRECYYNICENDGLCFYQSTERICYCTPEYSGNTCQNYTPQQL